jgi:hypothetical protein
MIVINRSNWQDLHIETSPQCRAIADKPFDSNRLPCGDGPNDVISHLYGRSIFSTDFDTHTEVL